MAFSTKIQPYEENSIDYANNTFDIDLKYQEDLKKTAKISVVLLLLGCVLLGAGITASTQHAFLCKELHITAKYLQTGGIASSAIGGIILLGTGIAVRHIYKKNQGNWIDIDDDTGQIVLDTKGNWKISKKTT